MSLFFHSFALVALAESAAPAWDSPGLIFGKFAAIGTLVFLHGFFVAAEFALV